MQRLHNVEKKKNKMKTRREPYEPLSDDRSSFEETRGDGSVGAEGNAGDGDGGRAITHKTIHITPVTLISSIDEWMSSESETVGPDGQESETIPVLLVALHACGSLTPDILRAFLLCNRETSSNGTTRKRKWIAAGAVVVGCCYNLLAPSGMLCYSSLAAI